jgi:hypothetical protein
MKCAVVFFNTWRFIMFPVITNIYNKKTKGPTLMELFTATGKLNFFGGGGLLEMFDVCNTGDTAHNDTIFKLLPHTRQLMLTRVWQHHGEHHETPCTRRKRLL